jgi:hypothetical protein
MSLKAAHIRDQDVSRQVDRREDKRFATYGG